MGKPLSSHTVQLNVDTASLEKAAEEIMWNVKAVVARDLLFEPLLGLTEQVFLLGMHVERGFDEENPPLAAAVAGITFALGSLADAVEDAKEVASFQMGKEELPAFQSLKVLADRLSGLCALEVTGMLDEEDPRGDAARAVIKAAEALRDAVKDAEEVSAGFQAASDGQQQEEG